MRTANELAALLRNWKSRSRGGDFEEIAQCLENQESFIEAQQIHINMLNQWIKQLDDERCEAQTRLHDMLYR